jgi:ribosomal protein S14
MEKIIVKKQCPKCGKDFKVERTKLNNGIVRIRKKEKQFCSLACANSREQNEEVKNKISSSLIGNIPWNKGKIKEKLYCKSCGKELCYTNKSGYCSICVRKTKKFREKSSKNLKKQYKLGRDIYGGKTKWYKYKNIKVQGTYELRTCIILDEMLRRGEITKWEYTNDRIKYLGTDNKIHSYLLDFKIDNIYYIETKGYIKENDILKWNEAENQGLIIKKWFLENIEKEEKRLNLE